MIVVYPWTFGRESVKRRNDHRIAYFGAALSLAGYEVLFCLDKEAILTLLPRDIVEQITTCSEHRIPKKAVFISDVLTCYHNRNRCSQTIAVEEFLFDNCSSNLRNIRNTAEALDVICTSSWKYSDVYDPDILFWAVKDSPGYVKTFTPKVLRMAFGIPNYEWLEKTGLCRAYLTNDLQTIRKTLNYHLGKQYRIGFAGSLRPDGRIQYMNRLAQSGCKMIGFVSKIHPREIPDVLKQDCYGDQPLTPLNYMRFLAKCELVPNLPGDCWGCSRLSEAILAGAVPIVSRNDYLDLEPAITEENCVLVDDLGDVEEIERAASNLESIRKNLDICYTNGWSPLGVMEHALARLGYEKDS